MPYPDTDLYPSPLLFPGVEAAPISWDSQEERYYQTGIDRGVLYPQTKPPVPFNGLTGTDEMGSAQSSILYRDGRVYLADMDPGDYEGTLTAFMYPDEFGECLGVPEVTDGLYVENQKPQRFDLSYRSLIGSGTEGDMFGYQIHLLYNVMASMGTRQRRTINATAAPMEFSFSLVATPVKLPGYRPSAHYIIDTRHLSPSSIQQLESILYGSDEAFARMPSPTELFDILNFGSAITFTTFMHSVLGLCWVASGSYANVHMTSPTTWEILNVNGTDHGDGTYTLEDTP